MSVDDPIHAYGERVFYRDPWKLLGLLIISIVFLAMASDTILDPPQSGKLSGQFGQILSWTVVTFCVPGVLMFLFRGVKSMFLRVPSISLSPDGIRYLEMSTATVRWNEIVTVELRKTRGGRVVALDTTDAAMARISEGVKFPTVAKFFDRVMPFKIALQLNTSATNTTPEYLYELCKAYHARYGQGDQSKKELVI